jgi:hypothetical protein
MERERGNDRRERGRRQVWGTTTTVALYIGTGAALCHDVKELPP